MDPNTDQQLSAISVVQGETVEFHVINDSGLPHNFHLGSAGDLSTAPEENDLPGVDTFTSGTETFTFTVDQLAADSPQFACTVPGHYTTMHGDIFVVTSDGQPGSSPAASPGGSAAPEGSSAPSAAPASAAPSAAP